MIDECSSGADNALPCAMKGLQILLLGGFDRDEPHCRAQCGFVNSFCIRRIVLGPLDERLHETRIDQQNLMPIGQKVPAPKMCAGAGLHGDGFRSEVLDRLEQFGPANLARKDHPVAVDSVTVKRALPEIDSEELKRHAFLLCARQCWQERWRRPSHNMRTAVDKIGRGKERQVNARFSAMVSHFLFEAEFCNPASGWEKGQIEKNVQDARHRFWQPAPNFPSLAALNDWLETRCREVWAQTPHGSHPGAIAEGWAEEVQHLIQIPRPFDGFVEYAKRVSPTCLVHLDRNRYSVPASFANRPVSVRVYPERIVVAAEGQVVCEHRRVFARSHQRKSTTTVFDWRHYLAVIQRKPGALRNGAPFAELPPAFRALQQRMLKTPGGDREMVEILALVLQHDEQAVLAAVELALEAGAPTKTHILNLLHRLVDGKPMDTPPIKAPQALTLTNEPQANVERYDALRKAREARHAS